MPKPINAQLLKKLGACLGQIEIFEIIFGDSDAPLSVKTAVKHAHDFDWNWSACNLLTEENRETYMKARATLLKTYDETIAPLCENYHKAVAPMQKTYEETIAPLKKTYRETIAKTFAELYLTQ
jgi:hypothetical protein